MSFYRYDAYPKGRKMKGFESLLLIGLVFTLFSSGVNKTVAVGNEVRSETLRLHIIANSDSEEDQALKLKVRDAVLEATGELFAEVSGKTEAVAAAEYSSDDIKSIAESVIAEEGFDYDVQVEVTEMWFETRSYEGFALPAGDYDAVRIIIGAGEGKNWWCVMYPALCIPGAEAEAAAKYGENAGFITGSGFEIRFAIIEWFEEFKRLFNK
ncbi:MAG: stage II sporulation protein R [Oscillospiraceae bacterium]|nr:stage II sporulation protein R [Oscillospiraceae bacterium]MBR3952928.1 stage II sporulation protein R [Oscillospiraceae bacterium]